MRLVNGNNTYEGRLEFCSAGIWGTVCSFGFGLAEAIVVCTQLNLTSTCKYDIQCIILCLCKVWYMYVNVYVRTCAFVADNLIWWEAWQI